jgi:hypothetical protein
MRPSRFFLVKYPMRTATISMTGCKAVNMIAITCHQVIRQIVQIRKGDDKRIWLSVLVSPAR